MDERVLHLMSWNVAGWRTSFTKIVKDHGSLEVFLDRLQVDILCLQEVKLTHQQLLDDKSRFGSKSERWDCFFNLSSRGENGVAVFARRGLTRSASCTISSVASAVQNFLLGRFLETDHGAFVLISLYVHNDGNDGGNVPQKMCLLGAVENRVRALKEAGRKVIVAGDLNAKMRSEDCAEDCRTMRWTQLRSLDDTVVGFPVLLRQMVQQMRQPGSEEMLRSALSSIRAKERTNSSKWELQLPNKDNRMTTLQTCHAESISASEWRWRHEDTVVATGSLCNGVVFSEQFLKQASVDHGEKHWVLYRGDEISPFLLVRVMNACFNGGGEAAVTSEGLVQAMVAWGSRHLDGTVFAAGKVCSTAWLKNLTMGDDAPLMDSFLHFHSSAVNRFTCWEQYTNRRYSNAGSRIDYFLVDRSLKDHLVLTTSSDGRAPLFGCACPPNTKCPPDFHCSHSDLAAFSAATCFNGWKPAPFDGGGLPDSHPDTQRQATFRPPHTGIVYTAPHYSDHVAVSCVLRIPKESSHTLASDSATRACQPHLRQPSVLEMFQKAKTNPSPSPSPPLQQKTEQEAELKRPKKDTPAPPPPKGIAAFFVKK